MTGLYSCQVWCPWQVCTLEKVIPWFEQLFEKLFPYLDWNMFKNLSLKKLSPYLNSVPIYSRRCRQNICIVRLVKLLKKGGLGRKVLQIFWPSLTFGEFLYLYNVPICRPHISYLRPRNGHFIPAGMKWSIPFRPEWSSSFRPEWNGPFHSGRNEMGHSIPAGMKCFIPFRPEWNGSFHSGGILHNYIRLTS